MRWEAFAEHLHERHHHRGHRVHAHCSCFDPHEADADDFRHGLAFDFHLGAGRPRGRVMRELWGLFEDWLDSLGDEIVAFARESGSVDGAAVAGRFKISERAARHLLRRLKREGRLRSRGLEPADDQSEAAPASD